MPDLLETALVVCTGVTLWLDGMVFNECLYILMEVLVCGTVERKHVDFVKSKGSAVLWVRVPWRCNLLVIVVCGLNVYPHCTVSFCYKL